jgi:SRSO17 transposase
VPADLGLGDYGATRSGMWTRGLRVRRSLTDGELAFFSTWCPAGTGIATLVSVEGRRWAIALAASLASERDGFVTGATTETSGSADRIM